MPQSRIVFEPEMEEQNSPTVEDWIVGTWDWKETLIHSRSVRPPDNRITPESAGYTEQRRFYPTGQVEFYRDGKLTGTYPYRIEPKGAPADETRRYVLDVGGLKWSNGTVRYPEKLKITPEIFQIGHGMDGGCGNVDVFTRAKAS